MEKRSYQRTSFWLFMLCFVVTVITDYLGISLKEVMTTTENAVQRTFENMKSFEIWLIPMAILLKEEISSWYKVKYNKDIEIEKLRQGKDNA